MIPLRDINPTRTTPIVVYVLVAINVAVFLFELALGREGMAVFTMELGVVPSDLVYDTGSGSIEWITPFTSMFMHGGFMHIIGNMWFLWIFGDNVEDVLGKGRFVVFYIACGLAAVAAQVAMNPSSEIPMVGASGAISGVLAGYVTLFPHARILTLVPIFIILQFMELPAYAFIFLWFGLQLLRGAMAIGEVGGGVAWWAHIGGFLAGLALVRVLPRRTRVVRAAG